MLKLGPCPECGKRKWRFSFSECTEVIVDLEKQEIYPKGTLIADKICVECNEFKERSYQKTK